MYVIWLFVLCYLIIGGIIRFLKLIKSVRPKPKPSAATPIPVTPAAPSVSEKDAIRQQKETDHIQEQIRKAEIKLATAQTDIDFLEPKRKSLADEIDKIEKERFWQTAGGHYENTDAKAEKNLERLKDKLYMIDKKLNKAHFDYETAETILERYEDIC